MSTPAFAAVDLTTCDQEPIHIPGLIQPHGALLIIDRDSALVRQCAGDTHRLLGRGPESLAGASLATVFDETLAARLNANFAGRFPSGRTTHQQITPLHAAVPIELTCFANALLGFVEIESVDAMPGPAGNGLDYTANLLRQHDSTDTVEEICAVAAPQIRGLTGFDRVCVYRFLHDGSGHIVAEDRAPHCESFLGLHYPASDIPQQARALYLRNWLRVIPDARYVPVPLVPPRPDLPPVDLSDCVLRAVAPIHLEYLANMGVTATLTLSLVVSGALWGLIACHHYVPRYLSAGIRTSCEIYARVLSLEIESRLALAQSRRRDAPRKVLGEIAARIPHTTSIAEELINGESNLLDLLPATGVAVQLHDALLVKGETPPLEVLRDLMGWVDQQREPIYSTEALGAAYPPAKPWAAVASGLLAVTVSRNPTYQVLWFRPELARSVRWAGNPDKMVEVGPHGDRLSPRKSFEAWQVESRGQAQAWDVSDFEVVNAFRLWLLEIVLVRADQERADREALFARQGQLIAELDHRVKNTLASVHSLLVQTSVGAGSVEAFVEGFRHRIQGMAHAHGLLAASHWEGAAVYTLVAEEIAPFLNAAATNVEIAGPPVVLSPTAAMTFNMVLHELVTNAAKHGALSTPDGSARIAWTTQPETGDLVLRWSELKGPPVASPTRRGFGSSVFQRLLQHELKGNCTIEFTPEGVRAELRIPARHLVEANNKDQADA